MKNILNWRALKTFGRSKFIRSSSIILTFLPILYKLKVFIEDVIHATTSQSITISLPFSWTLLFYAAILFGIATILFKLFCPKIVYEFNDHSDYINSGRFITQFREYLENTVSSKWLNKFVDLERVEMNEFQQELPNNDQLKEVPKDRKKCEEVFVFYSEFFHLDGLQFTRFGDSPEKTNEKHRFLIPHFRNLFYEVYEYSKHTKLWIRTVIFTLYLIGGSLILYNLVENILFVLGN